MAKLMSVFRLLLAFVLGLLAGSLGTVGAVWMNEGVADLVIGGTERVRSLERGLEAVEAQRNDLTRRLEGLTSTLEQVEKRYEGIGRRLETIEVGLRQGSREPRRAPVPPTGPPGP